MRAFTLTIELRMLEKTRLSFNHLKLIIFKFVFIYSIKVQNDI